VSRVSPGWRVLSGAAVCGAGCAGPRRARTRGVGVNPVRGSVGEGGRNQKTDVLKVQCLLNGVPPASGGPDAKLKLDGLCGPKTKAAIRRFQAKQLGMKWPDGRVDPGGKSELRLRGLEGTPDTSPMMYVAAARQQALAWANAGSAALEKLIRADGTTVPQAQADRVTVDNLQNAFNLIVYPKGPVLPPAETATPPVLKALRQRFVQLSALLASPSFVRYMDPRFLEAYGRFAPEAFPSLAPLHYGHAAGEFVNFKFCDWDPVNAWGVGPHTRAALVLQYAAGGAIGAPLVSPTASSLWIHAKMFQASLALSDPAHYLYFAQIMHRRDTSWAAPFHHVPEAGGTWFDTPGLP
jgi:hypothetical protein